MCEIKAVIQKSKYQIWRERKKKRQEKRKKGEKKNTQFFFQRKKKNALNLIIVHALFGV